MAPLQKNEPTLRACGVSGSDLFVFHARGANQPDSNIMIEFDPMAQVFVFNYSGQKGTIASLFDGPVDVVNRDGLNPTIRPAATADALYAF